MKIRYSISVLILIPILFLSACKVDESKNIRRVLAGDQLLCIHKDYFSWGGDPNSGSVFIVAMRPDMRPETRKERKTLDRDTYYLQKTNILLGPKWEGITESGLKSRKQNHSETGKRKYELIVTENHTNPQAWDLYLEPEHRNVNR